MTTNITLLVDNKAQPGLKAEHGLAIFIEHNGKRILFDNGQSEEVLFYNAQKLDISLAHLDIIILSHGHFDHGGNLSKILAANPNAIFYAHPDCLQTRYSLHPDKPPRAISLTKANISAINSFPNHNKKLITDVTEITPGIWLTGQIPRVSEFEDTGGPFYLDEHKNKADDINDDMSLWIESPDGLTVVCGCCHSGIVNTLNHIQHFSAKPAVKCLLGGLHLVNANQKRITPTIEYLNSQHIINIYPAHCTGDVAMNQLQAESNTQVEVAKAGLTLKV